MMCILRAFLIGLKSSENTEQKGRKQPKEKRQPKENSKPKFAKHFKSFSCTRQYTDTVSIKRRKLFDGWSIIDQARAFTIRRIEAEFAGEGGEAGQKKLGKSFSGYSNFPTRNNGSVYIEINYVKLSVFWRPVAESISSMAKTFLLVSEWKQWNRIMMPPYR